MSGGPLSRALPPAAGPAARPVVLAFALALLGVAGVCAHDLLVRGGALHRSALLPRLARWVDGLRMTDQAVTAAVLAVLAGALLVVAALRPRRRTHLAVGADSALWLRPTDLARLCSAAAMAQPGVARARTSVTPSRIVVTAYAGGRDLAALEQDVASAVGGVVAHLAAAPTVKVRLTSEGDR